MGKPNVMLAMPTAGAPQAAAIDSILRAAAEYGAPFCYSQVAPRDVNRNRIVQRFLDDKAGYEWLCMVDDDQLVPEGAIAALLAVQKPVVIAPTPILMDGRVMMNVARHSDDPQARYSWPSKHTFDLSGPPFRVAVGGTGLVLIERGVLERMEAPWFRESYGDSRGRGAQTEDVIFCERCAALGIEIWCQPAATCGHLKPVNLMDIATARELELGCYVKAN